MATVKYFAGTQEVQSPFYMRNADFEQEFPGVKGVRVDGYGKYVAHLDGSALAAVTRVIFRKANPSMHKCDARCRHAKGRNCECSCGGQFHGAGD